MAPITTTPVLASDDYVCYSKNGILLVLSAGDVDLGDLMFAQGTALVYAESITLSADISAPGKSLGFFCSRLTVTGTTVRTINVSGSNALDQPADQKKDGASGKPGKAAGHVWLYVENADDSSLPLLKIVADGGNGGRGGDTYAHNHGGGNGGNGGAAGSTNIFYGTKAWAPLLTLRSLRDRTWPEKLIAVQQKFIPECNMVVSSRLVDQCEKEAVVQVVLLSLSYLFSVDALVQVLQDLMAPKWEMSKETIETTRMCLELARQMLGSTDFPTSVDKSSIDSLSAFLCNSLESETKDEESIRKRIDNVAKDINSSSCESDFEASLKPVTDGLLAAVVKLETATTRDMCSTNGGNGGSGGVGPYADSPTGHPGSKGKDGTRRSIRLSFNGDAGDLRVEQICAFPEQCQMLLSKADRLFFTNTVDSRSEAASLYSRLIRRLAFVPLLLQTQKTESYALSKAYHHAEAELGLTIAAMAQLESILSQAWSRTLRIAVGQDMYAHDPSWAPRLSFQFYKARVDELLPMLRDVEKVVSKYRTAIENGASTADYLKASIQAGKDSKSQAEDRVSLQVGPNGALSTVALQIAQQTPLLNEERRKIKEKMKVVEKDVQKMQFNPQRILDALCLLLASPPKLSLPFAFADLAYKDWTTIEDSAGISVRKDYIIDKLTSCSNTLQSLEVAYISTGGGDIQVDLPGCAKITATAESIKSIIDQFKDHIPVTHRTDLSSALDRYVELIAKRNTAVVSYNAALQLLRESLTDTNYYTKQNQQLGNALLQLDPNLPAIHFWLARLRGTLRQDIMQRLNYEGRAVCFWGLRAPLAFTQAGPLRGYFDLLDNQAALKREFEACLESFASSAWSRWPSNADDHGLRYKLSVEESKDLLTAKAPADVGKHVYSTVVRMPPDSPLFAGMYNVRLTQVRVWLPGAKLTPEAGGTRQLLRIDVCHLGHETLKSPRDGGNIAYFFTHEPVALQFTYNTAGITSLDACKTGIVFGRQAIENDYVGGDVTRSAVAPLGPLADWKIELREIDNAGLDLRAVKEVWMEFCGRNMPAAAS